MAAIRLQNGHLLDRVSDQRCMTKSRSCPNLARIASQGDIYKTAHFEDYCEMAGGDVQAGEKVNDYLVLYVFWRATRIL